MKYRNVVVMVLMILSFASVSFAQELKVVGSWSFLSLYKNFEVPFWTEKLPAATDGKISANLTSFNEMGMKGGEVFRLMSMKLFDVGSTVANYAVSDSTALEGLDLPGIAPDIDTARKVVNAYRPVLDDIMNESFNAKLIGIAPYPAQVLFCNTEISGLSDLKGKKVRASGRTLAEFLDATGATGVTLAFSEVPQSLQRGVVDCAVTGSLSGFSAGWGEVSTHLYPLPIGGWAFVVTAMSLDTWKSLDKNTQDLLMTNFAKHLEDPVWDAVATETQQGINCLTGTGECPQGDPVKMKLVKVSKEDISVASNILNKVVLPKWSERVDKKWIDRWYETVGKTVGISK
ncbi:MAG: C4-dicarboxylate ABC transporter substrate-binding protein [Denitrovibrio sp.]|nr:MAG: C4-dicarboxylate ABC transporter substrate-binding protein [Denitrovibrio sp.]